MALKGSLKDQLLKRKQAMQNKDTKGTAQLGQKKNVQMRWMMIVGVIFIGTTIFASNQDQPKRKVPTNNDQFIDVTPKPMDTRRDPELRSQAEMNALQSRLDELAKQNSDLIKRMAEVEERRNQPQGTGPVSPPAGITPPPSVPVAPPPPPIPVVEPAPVAQAPVTPNEIPARPDVDGGPQALSPEGDGLTMSRGNSSNDRAVFKAPPLKSDKDKMANKTSQEKGVPLITGAFAPVALLTGLEAGTGQTNQANPEPILMRIQDNAVLPGGSKYKLKSCFVMGSGFGDRSTERVKIRAARLSCVDARNKLVLSSPIQGFVIDTDGALGMRGKVIDRQGLKLAQASLAGFAQGLAGALGQAQGTVTSTAFGATNAIGGSDALRASGLTGAQTAVSQLADFYLKEAATLFPVVRVESLRQGTLVISQDANLVWSDNGPTFDGNK